MLNQDPTNNWMDFAGGWVDTTYASWMDYTAHTIECWVGQTAALVGSGGPRLWSQPSLPVPDQHQARSDPLQHRWIDVRSYQCYHHQQQHQFYHLAYTFDGSVVRVYVNGVLDGTSGAMSGTLRTGGTNMVMGSLRAGGGSPGTWNLDGKLDEVAVYGTALSATRLLAHYNAGYILPPAAAQLSAMTPQVAMQLDNVQARSTGQTAQAAMYLDNTYARLTDMVMQVALQTPTDTIKVLSTDDFVRVYSADSGSPSGSSGRETMSHA